MYLQACLRHVFSLSLECQLLRMQQRCHFGQHMARLSMAIKSLLRISESNNTMTLC